VVRNRHGQERTSSDGFRSGRFTQDAQVPAAGAFCRSRRLQRGMGGALGRCCLDLWGQRCGFPDRVGQCQEVIGARLLRAGGHGQAKHFPAPGNSQGAGMLLAQIVTMRLGVRSKRTEDGGGVSVDVRQSSYR
jgi:hypothetical protein